MTTDLLTVAEASMELKRRYEESKILFYKPCCRVHSTRTDDGLVETNCPTSPCPDSKHWGVHISDKRIRVVLGGNRSGKSIVGLMELLMMACFKTNPLTGKRNPVGGQYRIYCPDFSLFEKNLIPKIREWIPVNALAGTGKTKAEAWENSYDKKYHILYLKDKRMLDFMSYDQVQSKSESVELDGTWLDEESPEEIFSAVEARSISRRGRIWITCTPLYGFTWAMKFLDSTDNNISLHYFDIYDNPYNSPQAIKEFEDSLADRPHEKEARIHGRFMELQGLVYKELRQDIHLIGTDHPKPGYPVIFALDPHPRKPCVMTWSYVTPKGDVVFFDELEMRGTAKEIARAIRAKESSFKSKVEIRLIDPAAKAQGSNIAFQTDTLTEFEREGMSFSLADNAEAGYNIVHEYLSYDVERPLSSMNRPRCYFTKDVPKTWFGMTHLMWDDWMFKKSLRDEKERIKDYKKDFPDTVRYTLAFRPSFRSFNPNPVPIGNMRELIDIQNRREVREIMGLGRVA